MVQLAFSQLVDQTWNILKYFNKESMNKFYYLSDSLLQPSNVEDKKYHDQLWCEIRTNAS